jgi:hypothetical protein
VANYEDDFDDAYEFDRPSYTAGGGGPDPYSGPMPMRTATNFSEPSFTQPTGGAQPSSGNDVIAGAYSQFLDRTGSQDEYNAHSGGGTWSADDPRIQEQVGYIQNSPEAQTHGQVKNFQSQVAALESSSDPVQRAQQRDRLARDIYTSLKQQGHEVKWQGDQLVVDGRPYDVAGAEWAGQGGSAQGKPQTSRGGGGGWQPVDPLTDLTFGASMSRMRPYTFDGFAARGGTGAQLDGLMSSILSNPESLSPQIVDTLKARAKDELAEMQGTREADLVDQQHRLGYEDESPFFLSERNAGRRAFDTSLVGANRDIDIEAATTNAADRRAAASLGTGYKSAEEGFRQAAGSQNLSANSIAGDLALRRAGQLTSDRQFDAGYGLDLARLEQDITDSDFARWLLLNGGV